MVSIIFLNIHHNLDILDILGSCLWLWPVSGKFLKNILHYIVRYKIMLTMIHLWRAHFGHFGAVPLNMSSISASLRCLQLFYE